MDNWIYYLIPLAFIAVVVYVYRPGAKKGYQKDAKIPFADDDDKSDKSAK
ncbi:CcoQ/FixQ family Cbb3-type cytochrome c oxidase assembly chaperone [Thiothrix litoralis]|uniref:CcoQ/FixQ family Cbb3-type cytochrome c oxidase assembly chaperone n=2 Tax=Thiothrix TaxID=1030 RepID=A0ABX7WS41_9GAMM|nr:CcoQ/FixQ family Cbb3-type cytochrome c oxidase assembly chaperone [Thiothrix litoralis]QTR44459.1 CcoQ/FixQ family Cbb3-type cytochrome c oxidase assembly chaperone [Thiothrix litoralis]